MAIPLPNLNLAASDPDNSVNYNMPVFGDARGGSITFGTKALSPNFGNNSLGSILVIGGAVAFAFYVWKKKGGK